MAKAVIYDFGANPVKNNPRRMSNARTLSIEGCSPFVSRLTSNIPDGKDSKVNEQQNNQSDNQSKKRKIPLVKLFALEDALVRANRRNLVEATLVERDCTRDYTSTYLTRPAPEGAIRVCDKNAGYFLLFQVLKNSRARKYGN